MDIRGSQYDVHPSDCTQFTGKSFFHPTVDHHLSLTLCTRFWRSYLRCYDQFLHNLKVVGCVSGRTACDHVSNYSTFNF